MAYYKNEKRHSTSKRMIDSFRMPQLLLATPIIATEILQIFKYTSMALVIENKRIEGKLAMPTSRN